MRKTLPFQRPLAYGYQFYAFPLGILAVHPQTTDWVLSNYLQLGYDLEGEAADVTFAFYTQDFTASPWLETLKLGRAFVMRYPGAVTGFVRDAIAQDYYVYLTLNERYVPDRQAYGGTRDFPHDPLVVGVDDESDTFELYGYDGDGDFRGTPIPQDDLLTAYCNTGPEPFHEVPVTLYRFNPAGEYQLDLAFIARGLVEYLDSVNPGERFRDLGMPFPNVRWGMASYEPFEVYLDEYARGEAAYNIRHLHVLWEHKRVMSARLRRCAELVPSVADLVAPYERVERLAWTLRTMMIAHRTGTGSADFRGEAIPILRTVRDSERDLVGRFAEALTRHQSAQAVA